MYTIAVAKVTIWPGWAIFNQIQKKRYKATIKSNETQYTTSSYGSIIQICIAILLFVVECSQKGHCHGQLDEQQLHFVLVVHKLHVFSFK
jgi:hypothetical protein